MSTSDERKTDGGKDDRDRSNLAKRQSAPFYWTSFCCSSHIKAKDGGWHCVHCKKPCKVVKPR